MKSDCVYLSNTARRPVLTLRATQAHYVRTTVVPSNGKGRGSESNLNKVWDVGVWFMIPPRAVEMLNVLDQRGGGMETLVVF